MAWTADEVDRLCINTIRTLSIDAIERAKSGHPGLPLGAAPMAYVLWQRHLKFDASDPDWPDRDRFVLSAGHGSMLIYSLLHLYGYPLPMSEIESFRQWGSLTPGHPEASVTAGIEATTGPLGQGSAVAVGMAMAEAMLASRYNGPDRELVDHRTWALVSDGDLMEGISSEAASLAGHLRLGKLTFLYDANDVSLDGPTSMAFTEDVAARFAAFGWQVLSVEDGDKDLGAIDDAIEEATRDTNRPSLILVKTTIGYGSPNKAGSAAAHGAPLGSDEVRLTKERLGWDPDASFHVPQAATLRFAAAREERGLKRAAWDETYARFTDDEPELAREWRASLASELPPGWDSTLPAWDEGAKAPTRSAAGKTLQSLAERVPWLVGGDADLSCSVKSRIDAAKDFSAAERGGRNVHFGVREHAMAAALNGMAYHRGIKPYGATFLQFSDYMRPSIRLAALDGLPVTYVFTHDSVAVGEDGPTHQPIEHVTTLRAIPRLHVVRPADPNEAAAAWRYAVNRSDGPTALILSRQNVPVLPETRERARAGVARGAYVLADAPSGEPDAIVIATGSEVARAREARKELAREGVAVRVVTMPCWEAFEAQSAGYREDVLPPRIRARVSVEAGTTLAWHRWIGDSGRAVGIDRFGASAPGDVALDKLGINVESVLRAVTEVLHGSLTESE